jgi:DNA-directed RNA polymerase subunit RPC12/RpoP
VRRYVTCPKCSHRNDRTGGRRKCENCREALPKRRVPKHAEILRDLSYEVWAELSAEIHGGELHSCGVCRRPLPAESRKHDRDHDHRTGLPRGLACVRCNRELLRNSTLEEARAVVAYLERSESYYAKESASDAA